MFARGVQCILAKECPIVGRILERGWHPVFDVPRERQAPESPSVSALRQRAEAAGDPIDQQKGGPIGS